MPSTSQAPLVRIKRKFQVTIPTAVRKRLDIALDEGDLLEASTDGRTIVLTPKALVDRAALDRELDQAIVDIDHGRGVGPFAGVEELRTVLRKA